MEGERREAEPLADVAHRRSPLHLLGHEATERLRRLLDPFPPADLSPGDLGELVPRRPCGRLLGLGSRLLEPALALPLGGLLALGLDLPPAQLGLEGFELIA